MRNYGQEALANADIAERWIRLNVKVFKDTGKLMEKDTMPRILGSSPAAVNTRDKMDLDGLNGVLLKLISLYGIAQRTINLKSQMIKEFDADAPCTDEASRPRFSPYPPAAS